MSTADEPNEGFLGVAPRGKPATVDPFGMSDECWRVLAEAIGLPMVKRPTADDLDQRVHLAAAEGRLAAESLTRH